MEILPDFPRIGRTVPEFDDNSLRELLKFSYRIIYKAEDSQIQIITVVHDKRDLSAIFED